MRNSWDISEENIKTWEAGLDRVFGGAQLPNSYQWTEMSDINNVLNALGGSDCVSIILPDGWNFSLQGSFIPEGYKGCLALKFYTSYLCVPTKLTFDYIGGKSHFCYFRLETAASELSLDEYITKQFSPIGIDLDENEYTNNTKLLSPVCIDPDEVYPMGRILGGTALILSSESRYAKVTERKCDPVNGLFDKHKYTSYDWSSQSKYNQARLRRFMEGLLRVPTS